MLDTDPRGDAHGIQIDTDSKLLLEAHTGWTRLIKNKKKSCIYGIGKQ